MLLGPALQSSAGGRGAEVPPAAPSQGVQLSPPPKVILKCPVEVLLLQMGWTSSGGGGFGAEAPAEGGVAAVDTRRANPPLTLSGEKFIGSSGSHTSSGLPTYAGQGKGKKGGGVRVEFGFPPQRLMANFSSTHRVPWRSEGVSRQGILGAARGGGPRRFCPLPCLGGSTTRALHACGFLRLRTKKWWRVFAAN